MNKTAIVSGLLVSTVLILPSPSLANDCNISKKAITGTYGFSASGDIFASNFLQYPIGQFAQLGAITNFQVKDDGSTLRGRWKASAETNFQHSEPVTSSFAGSFVVSKATCTGELFIDGIDSAVFSTIYLNNGNEQRSISRVPGVVVSYTNSKKLSIESNYRD